MNPKYVDKTDPQKCLARTIEEAGEVVAAAGKSARFGLDSYNPELPEEERETNAEWLLREMQDLQDAMKDMAQHLIFKGDAGVVYAPYVPERCPPGFFGKDCEDKL